MDFLGVNLDIKNLPELDPEFIPLHRFNEAFLRGAEKPVGIALERAGGEMAAVETRIHGTPEMYAADCYYIDRLVKTMLWMKGGYTTISAPSTARAGRGSSTGTTWRTSLSARSRSCRLTRCPRPRIRRKP